MIRINKTYTNLNVLLNFHKKKIQLNPILSTINDFNEFNFVKQSIKRSKTCPIIKM